MLTSVMRPLVYKIYVIKWPYSSKWRAHVGKVDLLPHIILLLNRLVWHKMPSHANCVVPGACFPVKKMFRDVRCTSSDAYVDLHWIRLAGGLVTVGCQAIGFCYVTIHVNSTFKVSFPAVFTMVVTQLMEDDCTELRSAGRCCMTAWSSHYNAHQEQAVCAFMDDSWDRRSVILSICEL